MTKVLFICLGNICRSPMAEFVLKDMAEKMGIEHQLYIQSAGTSAEEAGNPVHKGTQQRLLKEGISCNGKYAIQLKADDYNDFDWLLCMDNNNLRVAQHFFKVENSKKLKLLMDFTQNSRSIADPWYTGNFDKTYNDIYEGCKNFLEKVII